MNFGAQIIWTGSTPLQRAHRHSWRRYNGLPFLFSFCLLVLIIYDSLAAVTYRAEIESPKVEYAALEGHRFSIPLRIKNLGRLTWSTENSIFVSYHLYDGERNLLVWDHPRTVFPRPVEAGQSIEIDLPVVAPKKKGRYILEVDLVHELVTWFAQWTSEPLQISLTVRSVAEVSPRKVDLSFA